MRLLYRLLGIVGDVKAASRGPGALLRRKARSGAHRGPGAGAAAGAAAVATTPPMKLPLVLPEVLGAAPSPVYEHRSESGEVDTRDEAGGRGVPQRGDVCGDCERSQDRE